MTTTRAVAKALRANGRTVVLGTPPVADNSHFWVIGVKGKAVVVNIQTWSILGRGCYGYPNYVATRDALVAEARNLLEAVGIEYTKSLTPDQLFLSGYEPSDQSYTPADKERWLELNRGLQNG